MDTLIQFKVANGASLNLRDCSLYNFKTAIKMQDNSSKVAMKWCDIERCLNAVQVGHGGRFEATGCLIEDCQLGILVESNLDQDLEQSLLLTDVDNYAQTKQKIIPPPIKIKIDAPA
jgi:hypothetical protein